MPLRRPTWRPAALAFAAIGALASMTGASAQRPAAEGVTYWRDVAPIILDHCGSCHHPNGAGPFSLVTYADARQHASQMAVATANRFMPPWKSEPGYGDFIGQQHLSDREIQTIQRWVSGGAIEGNRSDLPSMPVWSEGWQLGTPDLVVTLPEPFLLRPDGPDLSRIFVFRVPTATTHFVKGFEFRPGNSRVVHHANIRIDRTPASRELDDQDPLPGYEGVRLHSAVYPDGHFLGWTPGQVAPLLPKGLAWTLTPGTDLVVEMHMVPTGKPETVQPSIGLYFSSDPPERIPEMLRLGRQSIDIPPGDNHYVETDSFVLPVDVEVQAVQPHAHYRARTVSGTAKLPDGTTKPLIYIKDWDFRWQHVYRYVEPIRLPKGTTLSMEFTFDNSSDNPRNPQQPPQRVTWGQWTNDEMGDLWVQMLARNERDRRTLSTAIEPKEMVEDVVGYEMMLRRDPSNDHLHDDAAVAYLKLGRNAQAVVHFEATAKLKPQSATAHFNLGTALTLDRRIDRAAAELRQAIALNPNYTLAHNNLGNVLLLQNDADGALKEFVEARRIDPTNIEAHYNIGSLARARGDLREAIREFRAALSVNQNSMPSLVALTWILAAAPDAAVRQPDEAIQLGSRLLQLTDQHDPAALDLAAVAYASGGQYDRAVALSQNALDLKPSEEIAGAIRKRQGLYKQRQPYVAP
jgi:tetratricopeptide (TPR) repeat protein/mono/diheme cytochrome c family protein